jgi:hypothetical protein
MSRKVPISFVTNARAFSWICISHWRAYAMTLKRVPSHRGIARDTWPIPKLSAGFCRSRTRPIACDAAGALRRFSRTRANGGPGADLPAHVKLPARWATAPACLFYPSLMPLVSVRMHPLEGKDALVVACVRAADTGDAGVPCENQ